MTRKTGRPRSSCSVCQAKRVRCMPGEDGGACLYCLDRGLAAKCDVAQARVRPAYVQGAELAPQPKRKRVRRLPLRASAPPPRYVGSGERIAPETAMLLEVALQSNVTTSFAHPGAVGYARRVVSTAWDPTSTEAVAARVVLHAVAAAGALSTCDARYAPQASANLCLARALLSSGVQQSPLAPFAHLALARCGLWARAVPTLMGDLVAATALASGLPLPAESPPPLQVNVLVELAAAALTTPRRQERPADTDPFAPDVGLTEFLICATRFMPVGVPLEDLLAHETGERPLRQQSKRRAVPWDSLATGSPRLRLMQAFHAVRAAAVDEETLLLKPVQADTEEKVRAVLRALDVRVDSDWCTVFAHMVRAVCHLQLRDTAAAEASTREAFTLALRDPRVLTFEPAQKTASVLINAWRSELSAAADALAPLLEATAHAMTTVYESLHSMARVVMAGAVYMPPRLLPPACVGVGVGGVDVDVGVGVGVGGVDVDVDVDMDIDIDIDELFGMLGSLDSAGQVPAMVSVSA